MVRTTLAEQLGITGFESVNLWLAIGLCMLGGIGWLLLPDKGEGWHHLTHVKKLLGAGRHLGTSALLGTLIGLDFATQAVNPLSAPTIWLGIATSGYFATDVLRNTLNRRAAAVTGVPRAGRATGTARRAVARTTRTVRRTAAGVRRGLPG